MPSPSWDDTFHMGLARFSRGALVALLALHTPAYGQTPSTAAPAQGATFEDAIGYNSRQWRIERVDANHLRLVGQVEVQREKLKFYADSVDIYNDKNLMVAEGNVVYVNEGNRISAERMEFDLQRQVGTFYEASGIAVLSAKSGRTTLGAREAEVYFYGRRIEKIGPQKYRLTDGAFTTCVQPEPRWELAAGTVTLTVDHYAVARNTVLRVKGVPVFYLPGLYYPIKKDERATGVLMPTYGSSTLRGPSISNGVFWAVSRSKDATFLHDWFSQTGQGFGAEYRYINAAPASLGTVKTYLLRQKAVTYKTLTGTATLPESRSYNLIADVMQTLPGGLRGRGHVDYFSSITAQQLYQTNIYQASQQTRTVMGSLSGAWGPYTFASMYQRDEVFSSPTQSYVVGFAPRVTSAIAPTRLFGSKLYGSIATDYSIQLYQNIDRKNQKTLDYGLQRFDLFPTARIPLTNWQFLTVNASGGARSTHYSRSVNTRGVQIPVPFTRQYVQGRVDVIGPVLVKIWDTPNSRNIEKRKHVIEPSFSIDRTSNFNFKRVAVLSDSTDYIPPGNTRLTYGLTNRFLTRERGTGTARGTSREFLTVGVQQSYYTSPFATQYDTTYLSSYIGKRLRPLSPVALMIRSIVARHADVNGRIEYDIQGLGLETISSGTTLSWANGANGSLSYSWRRTSPKQPASALVSGSTVVRAHERKVGGQYSVSYDISRRMLVTQQIVGFYNAQCCGFGIEFQKYNFPTIDPRFPIPQDTRINFSVTLAGLGSVSNFHGAMSAIPH